MTLNKKAEGGTMDVQQHHFHFFCLVSVTAKFGLPWQSLLMPAWALTLLSCLKCKGSMPMFLLFLSCAEKLTLSEQAEGALRT